MQNSSTFIYFTLYQSLMQFITKAASMNLKVVQKSFDSVIWLFFRNSLKHVDVLVKFVGTWVFSANISSLSGNPIKWSNTLKKFVGCCRRIVWVCLTILSGWHLKSQNVCFYSLSSDLWSDKTHFWSLFPFYTP